MTGENEQKLMYLNLAVNYCMSPNGKNLYPVDLAADMQDFVAGTYVASNSDIVAMLLQELGGDFQMAEPRSFTKKDNIVYLNAQEEVSDNEE